MALGWHETRHAVGAFECVDGIARQLTVHHTQASDRAVIGARDVAAAASLGDLRIVQLDRVAIDVGNAQACPGQRPEHQGFVQRARRGTDPDVVFADNVQAQAGVA